MRSYFKYALFLFVAVMLIITSINNSSAATDPVYGCFLDLNGDGSYDSLGEFGMCYSTPQGRICNLDATDCIIPSVGTGCPNLANISYDATTNQCVVPPRCPQDYTYDDAAHQCISQSPGICPDGASQDSSGVCHIAPTCPTGTYSFKYNQCIVTSSFACPLEATFDQNLNLCIATLSCEQGTTYSSTSNMCLDGSGAAVSNPSCPTGTALNSMTNRCEAVPPCSSMYDPDLKLCVDSMLAGTCSSNGSFNSATGICDAAPECAPGAIFNATTKTCISAVPAYCPPDGNLNLSKNRCEAPQGCTSGVTTSTDSLCLNTGPAVKAAICPPGTLINTTTNMCDTTPTCPYGRVYDQIGNVCVSSAIYTSALCPAGTALNIPIQRCQADHYNCNSPGYFDNNQHMCVFTPVNSCPVATGSYQTRGPWGSVSPVTSYWYQTTWYQPYQLCLGEPKICSDNGENTTCTFDDYIWVVFPYDWIGGVYLSEHNGICCSDWYFKWAMSCPPLFGLNSSNGYCYRPNEAVGCPYNTSLNPATNLCEASATCPAGYNYNTSAPSVSYSCIDSSTSPASCLAGTALNGNTDRCEAAPSCPIDYLYDPNSHVCQSTVRTCPLGTQYPCHDYNGKKMCSAIGCADLSTSPVTTAPEPPTAFQENDGEIDPGNGQCLGQLVIFPGKPEYCRPPGLATFSTNCCSAAHPGKFSRSEDLNTAVNDAVQAYKDTVDTYITNDLSTINIDERRTGYNASSPPAQNFPVVDGGSPVTYTIRRASDFAEPTLHYASSTSAGLTTIKTSYTTCLGTEFETADCAGITQISGSEVANIADPLIFANYMNDMQGLYRGCLNKGLSPNECAPNKFIDYIDLTQSFGNFTNDVHLEFNIQDPTLTMKVPVFVMDSNTGTCSVVGNYGDSRCEFRCSTSMSNGNLSMKVNYIHVDSGVLLEEVANVSKGPTGTAVTVKQQVYNTCDNYVQYETPQYTLGVRPPAMLGTTSIAGGKYSNMTVLHTEWMPEINNVYDSVFGMLYGVGAEGWNWLSSPCRPHELQTDTDRDAGKCHTVGHFCISEILGHCTQRKESNCCFTSKLARIIHEQGRPQLQKFDTNGGWGTPEAPNCIGFLPQEFQMLDFSKMDLSEFIATIVEPIAADIQNRISDKLNTFYNNTQSQGTGTVQ